MSRFLENKTVLITGASAGIGAACARAFAAEGARLVLTGRRQERLRTLADELEASRGLRPELHLFDVRDRAAIDAIRWPAIDVLLNNAGLARGTEPLQTADPDGWEETIDTNLKGLLYMTRAILPGMIERRSGHIVNLGSVAGFYTYPGGNVYCATKYAVRALTESLRLDVHGTGIRVSSVDPGLVETEFSVVRFGGDEQRARAVYEGMTPLSAEDVAEAVVFCASRPPHVNINHVLMMPVDQSAVTLVNRRK